MENLKDVAFCMKYADEAKDSSFPADFITPQKKHPTHPSI